VHRWRGLARIGIDGWPNSGNTWIRVPLHQAGGDIWKITWVIAPIEGPADAGYGHVPPGAPPNVQGGSAGKSLVDLLLVGDIDVLVAAFMPTGFFAPDSPFVPMILDYCAAEKAYYQQPSYVPAHHLIKLHREVVARAPWIVTNLMTVFTASKRRWLARRRHLANTTP
jgi:4,5-dihydroxyphthalate decarboxylase